jgi:UDP-N-acetylmuramoylalanine--D-glutamate ligase
MTELEGERIGVLGLARSGLAAVRLAVARGAEVYASDLGDNPATQAAAEELRQSGVDVDLGAHDIAKLAGCSRIVLSPGIPPTAKILQAPVLQGAAVVPEVDFAFALLESPVVAVTGTNGKTTVTALVAHLLCTAGIDAVAGGNIGTALSELALRDPQPEVAVVEISSFQLGLSRDFAPVVGVLTNLAPDHLDWYPDVEAYYADKARLFQNATPGSRWVLNGEDRRAPGERFYFRVDSLPATDEKGAFVAEGDTLTLRLDGRTEPLLTAPELAILGRHNVANALAAAVAARLMGADTRSVREGLRSFRPQPHRLEPVLERGGVLWINDSKATNVTATEVAVRSMERPTVLLLGGRHKGEPYDQLVPAMTGRVRQVLAFGEAASRVGEDLEGHLPVEQLSGDFEEVVRRAAQCATPGDVVLLSPACSSYDMFRDYEERGKRFAELADEVTR